MPSSDAEIAALRERLNAHDRAFSEIKTDVRSILATTVATNLAIAVLPTWENLKAREHELGEADADLSRRLQVLEKSATEATGSMKVIVVVASLLGSVLTALAGWASSYFSAPLPKL